MGGIDLSASAHAGLELVTNELHTIGERVARLSEGVERAMARPPAQPFVFRQNGTGKSGSSGDLVIALGGPASGRFWNVLSITCGGRGWGATAAGYALVIVSSSPPADTAGPTAFVVAQLVNGSATPASLPAANQFSPGQIRVNPPDQLFVAIATPTATTEYNVGATIEQFETGARVQTAASV